MLRPENDLNLSFISVIVATDCLNAILERYFALFFIKITGCECPVKLYDAQILHETDPLRYNILPTKLMEINEAVLDEIQSQSPHFGLTCLVLCRSRVFRDNNRVRTFEGSRYPY